MMPQVTKIKKKVKNIYFLVLSFESLKEKKYIICIYLGMKTLDSDNQDYFANISEVF